MGRRSRKRGSTPAPAARPAIRPPAPDADASAPTAPLDTGAQPRSARTATPGSSTARRDATAPHATPRGPRAPIAEAPKAPWSPFPLVELCVLVALVLIVVGFLSDGRRREAALAGGVVLASLAGLELAIREHVAGYRSHSALLAGAAAVAVGVPLFLLTGLPQIALVAVGVVVYTLAFTLLRRAFRLKTGGLGFRA